MKSLNHKLSGLTTISLIAAVLLLLTCRNEMPVVPEEPELPIGTTPIPASPQRTGDPQAGYDYLVAGNYIRSGIPYSVFVNTFGKDTKNELGRSGDNAEINYEFTAVDAPNGVRVVAPNCLQCHAQYLNGQLVVGLGNSTYDFTTDQSQNAALLETVIKAFYGSTSPQWEAAKNFTRAVKATGPYLITKVRGVNPADKLAAVLAAHRDVSDLSWYDESQMSLPAEVVPSDVPAWWLLKKKNAMFYNAAGRRDFARFMMASNLLTVSDSTEARDVDNHFNDVLAYILTLQPPAYPGALDQAQVEKGRVIFKENCESCHGTYGAEAAYPNLLVSLDRVGTDPQLAQANFAYPEFVDWYNRSWFSKNPNAARLEPGEGYIAPPLDGIWATAPYLHNGSVPTLEDLLNSTARPKYWKRSFDTSDYDQTKAGWNYSVETSGGSTSVYDTTLPGYGNQGHTFGDFLNDTDRAALIEYLKSL